MKKLQDTPAPAGPADRLSHVVEDVVVRRLAGEDLSDELVIERNRDLMPELAARLSELRRVEQARRRAVQSSDTAYGTDALRLIRDRRVEAVVPADAIPGYRIIRELHRGGQGVVYLAEQLSTRREVAVKVLREGPFAGPRDLARFEREVRILAQLRHPNIVAIHDSGTAPGGQFYFVMDYIAGRPFEDFLTAGAPASEINRRLALFARICEAVHAAHLRGVIHRDLKPSNIRLDAAGEPHVLDFGLARLAGEGDGENAGGAALTVTGQFVGSLPWASPEQAQGQTDGIDLRSDVYSLGVILYQMLTGHFPYPVTGPMRAVADSIARADPVRPRHHNAGLDEDLQTIVLRCLAKDPARRYQSAGDVAREIGRFRAGEPIEARRDSAAYVLRKTLRRHWAAASAAAAFVVLVAASAVAMWWMYSQQVRALSRAEAEADTSRRVVQFLQDMLAAADPDRARGSAVTVREVLDQAAAQIEGGFKDRPEVASEIHSTVGRTYLSLGDAAEAERHFRAAWEQAAVLGEDHIDVLTAIDGVATALEAQNRLTEAEPLFRRALDGMRRTAGDDSVAAINALHNLANFLRNAGRLGEAEAMLKEALEASIRTQGAEDPDTLITRRVLASLWQDLGRTDEAEHELRAVLAAQRRVQGDDAPTTIGTAQQLAMLLRNSGRLEEAQPLFEEVVESSRRVLGETHPDTLRTCNSYARFLHALKRYDEAEALFRNTIEQQRETLGSEHKDTLITSNNLALLLVETGRPAEAEPLALAVESTGRQALGDEHPDVLVWTNNLGNVHFRLGRYAEAAACYRRAAAGRERVLGERHPATLVSTSNLANALSESGDHAAAEELAQRVLETQQALHAAESVEVLLAMHDLAGILWRAGRSQEAEAAGRAALEGRVRARGEAHAETIASMLTVGRILMDLGRIDEAHALMERALALAAANLPGRHPLPGLLRAAMGRCLSRLERPLEAEAQLAQACDDLAAALGPDHPRTHDCHEELAALREAPAHGTANTP